MSKLVEQKNVGGEMKLVVTSRQVSESFNKRNSHVVEAIENKIKSLTAENSEVKVEKLFIPSTYIHNGNEYKEYLLTRDGFTFIVMGFTGAKADAWKLKYIEAFNKMEEELKGQALNTSKLSKELQAILMLDEKTVEMDNRIAKLENNMTIDYAQQEELRELANKKATSVLGGPYAPAYKELNKKVFANIWGDYKRIMQVNSYKNTPVKNFELGRKTIIEWQPHRDLALMIKGCNAQLRM